MYTAISRKVVGKNMHATIPKGMLLALILMPYNISIILKLNGHKKEG